MSTYDSADLLARCKRLADVPGVDEGFDDDDWYALLTDAQHHYYSEYATYVPHVLISAPTLLTSTDSNYTYNMPSSVVPLYVEVYDSTTGRLLRPGAYWDGQSDYVWEGTRIRIPDGATKSFASGPYARYIASPSAIDGSTEPTLVPAHTRRLLVWRAVGDWASRPGSLVPAKTFRDAETELWGKILVSLKTQNPFYGAAAIPGQGFSGFEYLSTVAGYTAI